MLGHILELLGHKCVLFDIFGTFKSDALQLLYNLVSKHLSRPKYYTPSTSTSPLPSYELDDNLLHLAPAEYSIHGTNIHFIIVYICGYFITVMKGCSSIWLQFGAGVSREGKKRISPNRFLRPADRFRLCNSTMPPTPNPRSTRATPLTPGQRFTLFIDTI